MEVVVKWANNSAPPGEVWNVTRIQDLRAADRFCNKTAPALGLLGDNLTGRGYIASATINGVEISGDHVAADLLYDDPVPAEERYPNGDISLSVTVWVDDINDQPETEFWAVRHYFYPARFNRKFNCIQPRHWREEWVASIGPTSRTVENPGKIVPIHGYENGCIGVHPWTEFVPPTNSAFLAHGIWCSNSLWEQIEKVDKYQNGTSKYRWKHWARLQTWEGAPAQ